MVKKIVLGLCLVLILCIGIFFYNVGYVPIIGGIIAEQKVNAYAKEVYDIDEKIEMGYNFYSMGNYNDGENFLYNLKENRIIDLQLYENNGSDTPYRQDYQKIIDGLEDGVSISDYYIGCSIDADDFSKKYYKLIIYDMTNGNALSEAESLTKPAEIVMEFIEAMETPYNFTSANVSYRDNNANYNISFEGVIPLTTELLIENTKIIEL